jgi:HSP20 family protein
LVFPAFLVKQQISFLVHLLNLTIQKERKKHRMNLLKNKDLLRELVMQGDLMNTIHGGICETRVKVFKAKDYMVIKVIAPSVPAASFNIVLDYNKLTLFSQFHPETEGVPQSRLKMPMFIKTFDVPATVDTDKMEALYETGQLKIILPYKRQDSLQRMVPIKTV